MNTQLIEEALKEFDKEFTNSHPGDSGAGGNYPQEPIYELCESDPNEYKKWFKNKMIAIATKAEVAGETKGLINAYEIVGKTKTPGYPDSKTNVSYFKRWARQAIWKTLSKKEL